MLYDEDYFERGIITGVSLYQNYRWMPELTIKMAHHIINYLGLEPNTSVLDFGCAKGYLVKALRILDINAYGCDISDYAISRSDSEVRPYCNTISDEDRPISWYRDFDWVISKDVMEHLDDGQIERFLRYAHSKTSQMFHVIPLGDGEKFLVPDYNKDITHRTAQNKWWWKDKFAKLGWATLLCENHVRGIKDDWVEQYPFGNGFFWLKSQRK